jgi:putative phosphoesterase
MTRLLVVSDSHGNFTRLQKILDEAEDYNYIIHCGDGASDLMNCTIPSGVKKIQVLGNVDLWREYHFEREEILEIEIFRFLITDGDLYNVKSDYEQLIFESKKKKCNGVFFGHTHIKNFSEFDDVVLFNPGPSSHGVYGIVELASEPLFSHYKIDA